MGSWRPKQPSVSRHISVDVLRYDKPERRADLRFSTHFKVIVLKQQFLSHALFESSVNPTVCPLVDGNREGKLVRRPPSPRLYLPSAKREAAISQIDKTQVGEKKDPESSSSRCKWRRSALGSGHREGLVMDS